MFHTDLYCKTLDQLDRAAAIRAIHQANLQLRAAQSGVENLDHMPAIQALDEQLRIAGPPGYSKPSDEIQP
jgi:hypothetical protein